MDNSLLVDRGFGSSPRVEQTMTQDDDSTLYQAHLRYCTF